MNWKAKVDATKSILEATIFSYDGKDMFGPKRL